MNYAILQTTLDLPDFDKLRRAFRSVSSLTDADAHILGNDAFGILVKGKPLAEATTLQAALRAEGIETHVIPEDDLPALPPTKFLNRVAASPEALTICDPVGRSFAVEWGHVMLIAAGSVRTVDFTRTETSRPVQRRHSLGLGTSYGYEDQETEVRFKEERNAHFLLEIILTRGVARYSINAGPAAPLLFRYLGERRTGSLAQNFALLVQDLMTYAPHAAVNRGAYSLREAGGSLFAYPSKNAFFEEITWLLWWLAMAERQDGN